MATKKLMLISIEPVQWPDKQLSTEDKIVYVKKSKYTFLDKSNNVVTAYLDQDEPLKFTDRVSPEETYTELLAHDYETIPREFAGKLKWQISL